MMSRRDKRRVYAGLAAVCLALFAIGLVYGYSGRKKPICPDGKPPVAQQDFGFGQVEFRCHDGQVVTK